ncbi:conserved hypothetical protein [Uncinocarpus reesii 1704]|uniref:glutathione synthase n=1 Tax=Uncinocarpus reesii (strain UAMH 1704) TaxID=336963 RepID=C4JNF8_UNCRE|nr:uncharacterized protein UREG_04364 [Uncinocarpus reesii 1704]EEP79518.1 conserved hypothetical protein [Uncinocarpus reesii 1704]
MVFGWGESHEAQKQVYGNEHDPKFSHELLAGAASFEGFKLFEDHQRKKGKSTLEFPFKSMTANAAFREGKQMSHQFAKELLAGFVGAEMDKMAQKRKMDPQQHEDARRYAQYNAEQLYDQHYVQGQGAGQYDPYQYTAPPPFCLEIGAGPSGVLNNPPLDRLQISQGFIILRFGTAMDQSAYSTYPPELSSEQKKYLVTTVKDWTIQHGLAVRPSPDVVSNASDANSVLATNAPVTLFPSLFPKSCYDSAVSVQTVYNELYAAITADEAWLGEIIENLVDVDDFVANLWKVHKAVKQEGYVQSLSVGLFRSDYMLHTPEGSNEQSLKQVEFNTISSSFGGLSCLVSRMHSNLLSSPPGTPIAYPSHQSLKEGAIPENTAIVTLAAGLAAAHEAYGSSKSSSPLPLCILFIVQDGERNLFDQLELSSRLTEFHKIPVFRVISSDVLRLTAIPQGNHSRPLIYTPPHAPSVQFEATTIYLRSFYGPKDYPDESAWQARAHLERSAAIKCPTILNQLSGCKKVQQVLAQPTGPDHLSRFLPHIDPQIIKQLRDTFAPQYDLSSPGQGRDLALNPTTAATHVLKPQREGGGNNIYRNAIPGYLRSMPERDWKGWILMELIQPPNSTRNIALRSDGEVLTGNVVGELGIFGTILWDNANGKVLRNEQGGWLMRTKAQDSDEGGVAAGFSSLDSILLI